MAGTFNTYSLTFGSFVLNNPSASDDIFYVKVSNSGTVLIAGSGGGSGTEYMQGGGGVAIDVNGNPFIAFDSWSPSLTLGGITLTNDSLDAYLIRSNPSCDWP
jgi:hypothetical protein